MSRSGLRTSGPAWVLGLIAISAGLSACNTPASGRQRAGGRDDLGAASFDLRVPGAQLDSVHWSISRGVPPAVVVAGDHQVPRSGPSAAFLVTGLLPGAYTVTLSGAALPSPVNPDPVDCAGSATFNVLAGMTAHTTVLLACTQMPTYSGLAVETTVHFEDCPYITLYLVSSTQPGIGGVVDAMASAGDRDPSLPLTYLWSASAPAGSPVGTFAAPGSPNTQFTCPAGYDGAQTLTIFVTNGVSRRPAACPLAAETITILCVPTSCGDGVLQTALGETCDNGVSPTGARRNGPGTGCSFSCQSETSPSSCGNGLLEPGETCDDGNIVGGDGCAPTCQIEACLCGNGIRESFCGEQCDDGNTTSCDGCAANCTVEAPGACGVAACLQCRESRRGQPAPGGCNAAMGCENLTDPTEQALCQGLLGCMYAHPTCWATNARDCFCGTASGTTCATAPNGVCLQEALAAAQVAPNDYVNGGIRFFNPSYPVGHATQEIVCDLTCGAAGVDCALPPANVCGNGVIEPGEQCDDGNTTRCDGCSSSCHLETPTCGDGCVQAAAGEQCDDGNAQSCDGCSSSCQLEAPAVCGNGLTECGEQCDDGNTTANDGCDACQIVFVQGCGNGIVEPALGESCDDGNTMDGDGCDHLCQIEDVPGLCTICREQRRGIGGGQGCNALMGCANIADPNDRLLCQNLLDCLYANPTCWATNPNVCFCGSTTGTACATMPDGVCLSQALAAAKAAPTDFTNGGIRYFNTSFPSGHATQEIVCDNKCIASGTSCP